MLNAHKAAKAYYFNIEAFKAAIRAVKTQAELARIFGKKYQNEISSILSRGDRLYIGDFLAISAVCGFSREQLLSFFEER